MILEDLASWIAEAATKGAVPVVTGRNGDMDTIGSAIALASSHPNLMACGLHLGKLANRLCTDLNACLLYTSPSPRDMRRSRMPSSA